jgi:hypothetical protein
MSRSEKLAGLVDHYMIHYGHKTRKAAIKAISQDLKNGLDLAPDARVALQYSVKS